MMMDMRQKQMEEMRNQQMEEQRNRLEENRRKLEEANRKRIEEQQAKMEQMRKQQEELMEKAREDKRKREEEVVKKKEEHRATMVIRRAAQRLRMVALPGIEAAKKELEEVMAKELENCYTAIEKVREECQAAINQADAKIAAVEEAKRKEEEKKAAEEQARREKAERHAKLLDDLAGLVNEADAVAKALEGKAAPLANGDDLKTSEEVNEVVEASEAANGELKARTKACMDFVAENRTELQEQPQLRGWGKGAQPPVPVDPEKPTLRILLAKVTELTRGADVTMKALTTNKAKATKKIDAAVKLDSSRKQIMKYDKDGDGLLSRKELQAYAKGEYLFTVPVSDMDLILKVLVEEGKRGVAPARLQRLKTLVGVARERVRDTQRREARLAKEKHVFEMKEAIKEKAEEAAKKAAEASEDAKKLEAATVPLAAKGKALKSTEMGPLAAEADELVKEAKASVAAVRAIVEALGEPEEPELKKLLTTETLKLSAQLTRLDGQISKCEASVSKFRADIAKKDMQEVEAFRSTAIKLMRLHQAKKDLSPEALFKAVDKNKDGRADESDLQNFFRTCEKPTEDGEDSAEGVELSKEEITRLFAYLDEDDEGALSKDMITGLVRCFMKVSKETVLTNVRSIKASKPVRRLEIGEVCELMEGPVSEGNVDLMRTRVRMLKDQVEGWVTPVGNQGTLFLEEREGGLTMKVVKETILTPTFAIAGEGVKEETRKLKNTTRKLKEGELVEVREWMRKEEASGLMRMKVRTTSGQIGWATAVGNSGAVFLEIC